MIVFLLSKEHKIIRKLTFADSTPLYGVIIDSSNKSYVPNLASLKGKSIDYHEVDSYLLD